jgi:hypothetical protein
VEGARPARRGAKYFARSTARTRPAQLARAWSSHRAACASRRMMALASDSVPSQILSPIRTPAVAATHNGRGRPELAGGTRAARSAIRAPGLRVAAVRGRGARDGPRRAANCGWCIMERGHCPPARVAYPARPTAGTPAAPVAPSWSSAARLNDGGESGRRTRGAHPYPQPGGRGDGQRAAGARNCRRHRAREAPSDAPVLRAAPVPGRGAHDRPRRAVGWPAVHRGRGTGRRRARRIAAGREAARHCPLGSKIALGVITPIRTAEEHLKRQNP